MAEAERTLQEVLSAFDFGAPVVGAVRYGEGHINDTFCVHTQPADRPCRRFILQRMSAAAFKRPDQLMENIIGVTDYLGREIEKNGGDRSREALEVLRPKNGEPFFVDSEGGPWRLYPFVEHTICYQSAETPELFAASAGLRPVPKAPPGLPGGHPLRDHPQFPQHRGPSGQAESRRGIRPPGPGR